MQISRFNIDSLILERNRSGTITVSEIYVTGPGYVNRANSAVEDLESSTVYPSTIGLPSYAGAYIITSKTKLSGPHTKNYFLEYQEPPPKYDDVIKKNPVLQAVHQTTIQIQDATQVRSDRY